MKESIIFILFVVFLVGANLFWVNKNYDLDSKPAQKVEQKISAIKIAGKTIKVELADTPEKIVQGLSGRVSIEEDGGMLFIFESSSKQAFWMKDMHFSIDMIWLAEDGRVAFIKHSATPESFPTVFAPDKDAKYVLEVRAGFAKKNNLKVGDGVEFVLE